MAEFAEQEIVIPTGRFEGRRFRPDRNPFARLWFNEVDSGGWRRFAATGPQQSGKTLKGFVIPMIYHLFEVQEDVICGLPSLDMVADKWNDDIYPVIAASRYADLLPSEGVGSRGGKNPRRIQFRNGRTLRFMSGGGSDKARSGKTGRVLVVTEVDGMDESGGSSREADKITQLEGRTRSYGSNARIYLECTTSVKRGRIWQEYSNGSESRIVIRCPDCLAWVTPEREHLVGWEDAADELAAAENARIVCPSCGGLWDEPKRSQANQTCQLVHRGQEVTPEGKIVGPRPRTDTLGFRWTVANNLLVDIGETAKAEWKKKRATDEDNAEKALCQFYWALPYEPDPAQAMALDHSLIVQRYTKDQRGQMPGDSTQVVVAVDLGKWLCHWSAVAWRPRATPHVIDYGRFEVPSDRLTTEEALLLSLRDFRDGVLAKGWKAHDGAPVYPTMSLVDAGNFTSVARRFCDESVIPIWPCKGFGVGQYVDSQYREKKSTGARTVWTGDHYHAVEDGNGEKALFEIDVDYWKSWVHERLLTPPGQSGALTLFQGIDHLSFAKHLTAERKVEQFEAGKGLVTKWHTESRNNHWFDAMTYASVAGHALGHRLLIDEQPEPQAPTQPATQQQAPSNWATNYQGRY